MHTWQTEETFDKKQNNNEHQKNKIKEDYPNTSQLSPHDFFLKK